MADRNIGALPQAAQLGDDSLLVAEQQGQAVKVTGAQFKEFGRQAVIGQVQGYVDAAEAAAAQAVSAVSAVTGMTVEAHSSETATVTKTTKNGKVNLNFGLPQGEKGEPGPEGPQGIRGPRGEPGSGLKILGYYDTPDALRAAQTSPSVGDAYGIGTEPPYNIYVFDGLTLDWKDNGQLSGDGGGSILPENVVTTAGGAEMFFSSGDGPHTISFDYEEEPPLTAEDITYSDTQTVKEAMDGLFTSVSDGKALIASAITDKGVTTAQDASFADMAANIGQITTGNDTSDATATPGDILAGKTAYTAAGKVEGIIRTLAAKTYTPSTAAQTIANGQYLGGTQTIQGDPNLTSSNIKKGVSIFGVAGAVEQNFLATLTVKADTGAVVTATHTGGTKVEALSTNGQVVLELPIEGTWSVTAVRGIAQYNTVTIQVSAHYNAELTAEIHIEYYGAATGLSQPRYYLAAATVRNYALFGGGSYGRGGSAGYQTYATVDAYDNNFTHSNPTNMSIDRRKYGACATGTYALFAGGTNHYENSHRSRVDAYDGSLTRSSPEALSEVRYSLGAAAVGNHALFAGGKGDKNSNAVDAYDQTLTHSIATPLLSNSGATYGGSNSNYAIFMSGNQATAYDKNLTRTAMVADVSAIGPAVRAGNYVLFFGSDNAIAFDLFLTKTLVEGFGVSNTPYDFAATTVNNLAVIGGMSEDIFMYDSFLVKTKASIFHTRTPYLAATTLGNYAIFGGGSYAPSNVDIYRYV